MSSPETEGSSALEKFATVVAQKIAEAGAAVSGTAAVGGTGHEVAVAAASTMAVSLAQGAIAASRKLFTRNAEEVLGLAVVSAAVSAEDFLQQVLSSDRTLQLFAGVMEAAARAQGEDQRRALARALREGILATDDATADQATQMIRTLADLEPVHYRVLQQMSLPVEGAENSAFPDRAYRYATNTLRRALPGLASIIDPVVSVLDRNGLIRAISGGGGSFGGGGTAVDVFEITEFGRDVLDFVATA